MAKNTGQSLLQLLVDKSSADLSGGGGGDFSDFDILKRQLIQNLGRRRQDILQDAQSRLVGMGLGDQPHLLQRAQQNVEVGLAQQAGDIEGQVGMGKLQAMRQAEQEKFMRALGLYGVMKAPSQKKGNIWDFLGGAVSGAASNPGLFT